METKKEKIKIRIKGKKPKKKTKSFVANYSTEIKSILVQLAVAYRGTDSNSNLHGFIIDCLRTGRMVRNDQFTKQKDTIYMSSVHGLSSNISQAQALNRYIASNKSLMPMLNTKINHNNQPISSEILIDKILSEIKNIHFFISSVELGYYQETEQYLIKLKNKLMAYDRKSKINRKQERGSIKEKQVKLELSEADSQILTDKAYHYLSFGSYTNEDDQKLEKINKTAALLQTIYDCQQVTSGYEISIETTNELKIASDIFNEQIKRFNELKLKAVGFKPIDLHDCLIELLRSLRKIKNKIQVYK